MLPTLCRRNKNFKNGNDRVFKQILMLYSYLSAFIKSFDILCHLRKCFKWSLEQNILWTLLVCISLAKHLPKPRTRPSDKWRHEPSASSWALIDRPRCVCSCTNGRKGWGHQRGLNKTEERGEISYCIPWIHFTSNRGLLLRLLLNYSPTYFWNYENGI